MCVQGPRLTVALAPEQQLSACVAALPGVLHGLRGGRLCGYGGTTRVRDGRKGKPPKETNQPSPRRAQQRIPEVRSQRAAECEGDRRVAQTYIPVVKGGARLAGHRRRVLVVVDDLWREHDVVLRGGNRRAGARAAPRRAQPAGGAAAAATTAAAAAAAQAARAATRAGAAHAGGSQNVCTAYNNPINPVQLFPHPDRLVPA